jgi:hypothetical protein
MDGKPEEDIPSYLVMKGINQSANIGVKNNDITGGEPLLRENDVIDFSKYGKSKGISFGTMTNSFYATTPEDGYSMALRLKDAGMDSIGFSLDVDHQEHIPFSSVVNSVGGAIKAGIDNIGIHVTKRKSIADQNLELLGKLINEIGGRYTEGFVEVNNRPIYLHFGVVNRIGNASNLPESEFYLSRESRSGCNETSMTIRNDGEIVPCCNTYSLSGNRYSFGNIRDTDIAEVIENINGSVIDFLLSPMGLERARNIIRKSGNKEAKKTLTKKYSIYCEQCSEFVSEPIRSIIEGEIKNYEGIKPSLIFEEGQRGTKVSVDTGSQIINIGYYGGILSSRDFWTQAMDHKRRMILKSGRTDKKSQKLKSYLDSEINKVTLLPKVE